MCACLYVKHPRVASDKGISCCPKGRRPLRQSLHSILFASAVTMNQTHSKHSIFVSTSQTATLRTAGYTQTSSKPRHPALTFLTAENPGDMPADELLEMLKTAKLGSVTGNLQELVLADISDSSLSTREGLRFNQHPSFLASNDPGDLHPQRVGGSENP